MPNQDIIYSLNQKPGIWRDWTPVSSPGYVDGENVRWLHSRAKKIGGCRQIAGVGLTPNGTYLTANGLPLAADRSNIALTGNVRAIKIYPYNTKYIIVVCTDVIGSFSSMDEVDPSEVLTPSGVWIGLSDDGFTGNVIMYPVRLQRYLAPPPDGGVPEPTAFKPGNYNWSISIFGTTSGGSGIDSPSSQNISELSALGLVIHAESTLQNPNDGSNGYVYFGKLGTMLNFDVIANYVADPNLATVPTEVDKRVSPKYVFSPMMYPITSDPIDGTIPSPNPYLKPLPVDTNAIVSTSDVWVSGGSITTGPFLFAYGNNGVIRNCTANSPDWWFNMGNQYYNYNPQLANDVNIDNYKIIKGLPIRSGVALSAAFWTSNTVLVATFVGAPAIFNFSILDTASTLLAANAVVEHNGIFYWVGTERFYSSNGQAVSELDNNVNLNWFFDNANSSQRGKVYAFKVPRYHEIWWCFPKGSATECNHAIIYNIKEQTWYDTPLDRTAGTYDTSFNKPILAGQDIRTTVDSIAAGSDGVIYHTATTADLKAIWVHEEGLNSVSTNDVNSIRSSFTTGNFAFTSGSPDAGGQHLQGSTMTTKLDRIEWDGFIKGEQTVNIISRQYPHSDDIITSDLVLDSKINTFNEQGGIMQLKITSDVIDGDFFVGKPFITAFTTDRRR